MQGCIDVIEMNYINVIAVEKNEYVPSAVIVVDEALLTTGIVLTLLVVAFAIFHVFRDISSRKKREDKITFLSYSTFLVLFTLRGIRAAP